MDGSGPNWQTKSKKHATRPANIHLYMHICMYIIYMYMVLVVLVVLGRLLLQRSGGSKALQGCGSVAGRAGVSRSPFFSRQLLATIFHTPCGYGPGSMSRRRPCSAIFNRALRASTPRAAGRTSASPGAAGSCDVAGCCCCCHCWPRPPLLSCCRQCCGFPPLRPLF